MSDDPHADCNRAIEALWSERDDLRAENERLKAENARLSTLQEQRCMVHAAFTADGDCVYCDHELAQEECDALRARLETALAVVRVARKQAGKVLGRYECLDPHCEQAWPCVFLREANAALSEHVDPEER